MAGRRWRKSTYSNDNGSCVEMAALDEDRVAVRDSKNNEAGPVLTFNPLPWQAFLHSTKTGEFD